MTLQRYSLVFANDKEQSTRGVTIEAQCIRGAMRQALLWIKDSYPDFEFNRLSVQGDVLPVEKKARKKHYKKKREEGRPIVVYDGLTRREV